MCTGCPPCRRPFGATVTRFLYGPLWGGRATDQFGSNFSLDSLCIGKKKPCPPVEHRPSGEARPNTPKGPLAILTAAAHSCFAQADVPWPLFTADTQATSLGLSRYWDDSLALRVHQALAAFGFPAYQHPPPKPHRTPAGECRSLFISGMNGRGENAPASVSGSIIHTANSYALTGLEMEQVRENQGRPVRYDLTHRPLLLSSSGNASHGPSKFGPRLSTHTLKDATCLLV